MLFVSCLVLGKYFLLASGFSHSVDTVFQRADMFDFKEVQLINSFFHGSGLGVSRKASLYPRSFRFSPMLSPKSLKLP